MAKEEQKQEGYIKRADFIAAVTKFDYDPDAIAMFLQAQGHSTNVQQVKRRISRMVSSGTLSLKSGNKPEAGLVLKKTSTMYDKDGKVRLQWVSSEQSKEAQLEAFEKAISAITSNITPALPVEAPTQSVSDSMSVYTIGDAHVGMLAWAPESGEDNDLPIIVDRHTKAMQMLVSQSNATREAFIVDVGEIADDKSGN